MALTRLLLGLWATAHGFLGPVAAPRRAAPLHVIETEPSTDEKEIFSETSSISGALAELWQVLANPPPPGDFRAMYFPQCERLKRPQTFQALFEHLEVCKDSSQKCSCGVLLFSSRCSRWHRVYVRTKVLRRVLACVEIKILRAPDALVDFHTGPCRLRGVRTRPGKSAAV